jgi:hypothetical protein
MTFVVVFALDATLPPSLPTPVQMGVGNVANNVGYIIEIFPQQNTLQFQARVGTGVANVVTGYITQTGGGRRLHRLYLTMDSANLRLYVNGSTSTVSAAATAYGAPVGNRLVVGAFPMSGYADLGFCGVAAMLYSNTIALSGAQVATLDAAIVAAAQNGDYVDTAAFPSLVNYWDGRSNALLAGWTDRQAGVVLSQISPNANLGAVLADYPAVPA